MSAPSADQPPSGAALWARPSAAMAAGGRRAFLTVVDQGFSSISNFLVGVVVARVAGAAGLGGFAVAYATWVMLAGLHRSLITDPMAIEGDVRDAEARWQIQRGFAAEVLLGAAGTLIFAVIGIVLLVLGVHTFGIAMLAMAPWLILLLTQDYWRWVGFMCRQPGRSLANDTVFNCIQGTGFAALLLGHFHSMSIVIAAWGLGAAAGAVFGLWQNRVKPTWRGGLGLLRERWSLSKWLAGMSLLGTGSNQAFQVVVAAVLGPAGLGALRAAQNLIMGPAGVLIQAGGSIGLPEASRAYSEKGWPGLLRVTRIVMVAGFLSGLGSVIVVVIWGRRLLSLVYGPSFAHLQSAALIIGIGFISIACLLGPILVLKATRHTKWLFHVEVVNMVASVASAAVLGALYGLDGAATSVVVTSLATMVALRWFQYRVPKVMPGAAAGNGKLGGSPKPAALTVRVQVRRRLSRL